MRAASQALILLALATPARAADGGAAGPRWVDEWDVAAYVEVYLTYNNQGAPRGAVDFESQNSGIVTANHPLGPGRFTARGQFSLEPATLRPEGSPQLAQWGEVQDGVLQVDSRRPKNFFMEAGADWVTNLATHTQLRLYAAPVGEATLGPVPYVRRLSAMENPEAPLSATLQEGSSVAEGVLSAGLKSGSGDQRSFQVEGSLFHGREPDAEHWDLAPGVLDSWAVRLTAKPYTGVVASLSRGHLVAPFRGLPGDWDRTCFTLSGERLYKQSLVAATVVWARNSMPGQRLDSFLAEALYSWNLFSFFGRYERLDRPGLLGPSQPVGLESPRVVAVTAGVVHELPLAGGWKTGLGTDVVFHGMPDVYAASYGRYPTSFHVFLRIRSEGRRARPQLE